MVDDQTQNRTCNSKDFRSNTSALKACRWKTDEVPVTQARYVNMPIYNRGEKKETNNPPNGHKTEETEITSLCCSYQRTPMPKSRKN